MTLVEPSPPRESRHGRLELGTEGTICTYGFSFRRPKAVQVSYPDGRVRRTTVSRNSDNLRWVAAHGDPLGRYAVTVTQGPRQAELDFVVSAPTREWVLILDRDQVVGRAVRFILTGFAPDVEVVLDLYRLRRVLPLRPGEGITYGDFRYFNSVATRTLSDGTGAHRIPTSRADRPGSYLVRARIERRVIEPVRPDVYLRPPER